MPEDALRDATSHTLRDATNHALRDATSHALCHAKPDTLRRARGCEKRSRCAAMAGRPATGSR